MAIPVTGSPERIDYEQIELLPGVMRVVRVGKPYKLVAREFKPDDTVIKLNGLTIGGDELVVMAGPCAVESREQLLEIAHAVKEAGASVLRGGRLSPKHRGIQLPGIGGERAGNSGTTMRLLSGLLAGQPFFSILTGDASLRQRPMKRVLEPLQQMGAHISGRDHDRFAPLAFQGGPLKPIDNTMKVGSAQVKSAILLVAFYAEGQTVIREPASSREHTERMLRYMDKDLQTTNLEIFIKGGGQLQAGLIAILAISHLRPIWGGRDYGQKVKAQV